jgi:regulator of cell morphogenesis and NO signaling
MQRTLETTDSIGHLVTEHLARSAVFERFGIDYCCGGDRSLEAACRAAKADPADVLQALQAIDDCSNDLDVDWTSISMSDLIDHILETHHAYLREELPALSVLLEKVANHHGDAHQELLACLDVFTAMRAELEEHMMKEEQILFPFVKELEQAQTMPAFHCGSIENPISMMIHEHENAGQGLKTLRKLTDGFAPPDDACESYRALYERLAKFEKNMFRHIHKENNILFPRAIETERTLTAG